jgi:hypothetical protein
MRPTFPIPPELIQYFDHHPGRIHRPTEFDRVLADHTEEWKLPANVTSLRWAERLEAAGNLEVLEFDFPKPYRRQVRYIWGRAPFWEVLQTLQPRCYFSHYSAMRIHGLTEQLPQTYYLTVEQKNSSISSGTLTQASLDIAFRREPRSTNNVATGADHRVVMVAGRNTGRLGVVREKVDLNGEGPVGPLEFTSLSRTLIDAVVRPSYAGGIYEVAKAFELARDRLNVANLAATLHRLEYIYPYRQAVGYYLERAGYPTSDLDAFRAEPFEFDFYLTHAMRETRLIPNWRLHVPNGF